MYVYLCVILCHILCIFVFLCDILLPSGVINDETMIPTSVFEIPKIPNTDN